MISVNDFKTGLTIEFDGSIWRVVDFQHVKPGKGAAFECGIVSSYRYYWSNHDGKSKTYPV